MRAAFRPAHAKGTFHEHGGFTDSGWIDSDDVLALSESEAELVREIRPVVGETLELSEVLELAWNRKPTFTETLHLTESLNMQLVGKINVESRATVAPARAILTTSFGQGGFGQAGFGGSGEINA